MKKDAESVDQRLQQFVATCRQEGITLTHQRMEIFREVAMANDHPDAEQIFQRVRDRLPTLSLDTVYRTLWLLNDLGLVTTLGSSHDRARFDANLRSHHHFVCRECGYTRDFYDEQLNNLTLPESIGAFGVIAATHVEVRGICRPCLEKRQQQHNNGR